MFDDVMWDEEVFGGDAEEAYRLTLAAESDDTTAGGDVLPDDLEGVEPGLFLAAVLFSVDPGRLTGFDLVRYVQARERLVSHDQAGFHVGIAELAYAVAPHTTQRADVPVEFASDEIQTALVMTRRSADRLLGLALDLVVRYPRLADALSAGQVDTSRTKVVVSEVATLHPDVASQVVERILG